MNFSDAYSAAQFASTVALLMVAVLNVWRWYRVRHGDTSVMQPVIMLLSAAIFAVMGIKQGIWAIRGALFAAGLDGPVMFPDPLVSAMALNISITLLSLAIFAVAAQIMGGTRTVSVAVAAFGMLVITALALGGYNG